MRDLTHRYLQRRKLPRQQVGWAIHHSVTYMPEDASAAEEIAHLDLINGWHLNRGFSMGIGYHVAVFPSGRAYKVGHYDTQRAHVALQNHKYLGLVFIMSATSRRPPSDKMLATAAEVIRKDGRPIVGGHKDIKGQSTACPGGWDLTLLRRKLMGYGVPLEMTDPKMWDALLDAIRYKRTALVRTAPNKVIYEIVMRPW